MLVGVGFSCQAAFEGTHYRRLPASRDPRFAWVFDGIEEDVLGDYGLSGGGAAGFELDRADAALGTPDGAAILARSENPLSSFLTVPEELLSNTISINGEPVEDRRAARSCTSTHRPAARCSRSARSPSAAACGATASKGRSRACWRTWYGVLPRGNADLGSV